MIQFLLWGRGCDITKHIVWTKDIMEAFIMEGNLNERQEFIVRTRAAGYTIARQAYELHLSVDQINKEIARLKRIYDVVQNNSFGLPNRINNNIKLLNI